MILNPQFKETAFNYNLKGKILVVDEINDLRMLAVFWRALGSLKSKILILLISESSQILHMQHLALALWCCSQGKAMLGKALQRMYCFR